MTVHATVAAAHQRCTRGAAAEARTPQERPRLLPARSARLPAQAAIWPAGVSRSAGDVSQLHLTSPQAVSRLLVASLTLRRWHSRLPSSSVSCDAASESTASSSSATATCGKTSRQIGHAILQRLIRAGTSLTAAHPASVERNCQRHSQRPRGISRCRVDSQTGEQCPSAAASLGADGRPAQLPLIRCHRNTLQVTGESFASLRTLGFQHSFSSRLHCRCTPGLPAGSSRCQAAVTSAAAVSRSPPSLRPEKPAQSRRLPAEPAAQLDAAARLCGCTGTASIPTNIIIADFRKQCAVPISSEISAEHQNLLSFVTHQH